MHRQAGNDQHRSRLRERVWPKQEVKSLRQALKDVPSALDKNERFRRVSALVGGGRSKKDCYDKYKELKAEAKVKQQKILRAASGTSTQSASSREHCHSPAKRHTVATYTDQADFLSSTSSGRLSGRGSAFSSWSLNPTDVSGQQREPLQRRRSTASSTFSSALSETPEDVTSYGNDDRRTRGSTSSHTDHERGSVEDMGAVEVTHNLDCDSMETPRGSGGSTRSNRARTVDITTATEGVQGTSQYTVNSEEELMEVEEIDAEEFCVDDEFLVTKSSFASRTTQKRGGGYEDCHRGSISQPLYASTSIGVDDGGSYGGGDLANQLNKRTTVTDEEANGARELVFGDPSKSFNDAWKEQGFYFCSVDGLRYGLVQAEGGPCGVLAAVQAFILEDMVFGGSAGCDWRSPKRSQREGSLVSALTTIIWRAGDGRTAVLAVIEGDATVQRSSRYRPDGFTERLKLHRAASIGALQGLIRDNLSQYKERRGQGVILLVYSCIFSRGIEAVRGDMDNNFGEPSILMARHGYASQELVNLLLIGRAHSNVFDGRRVMGDGRGDAIAGVRGSEGEEGPGSDLLVLTGVPERGRVGFLTLFEAYRHMEVGDRFKNPATPIWVVCSESHYSVLFCSDGSLALPMSSTSSLKTKESSTTGAAKAASGQPEQWKTLDSLSDAVPPFTTAARVEENTASGRGDGVAHDWTFGSGRGKHESSEVAKREPHGEVGDGHLRLRQEERQDVEPFDLEYYDGLGRQDEVIRLTVNQRQDGVNRVPPPTAEDEANGALVPPLDLVIRTRWPGATVDWNGSDPIL